jgi:metal-responsive CopG/Arc/MetJ family transcriptional regulator
MGNTRGGSQRKTKKRKVPKGYAVLKVDLPDDLVEQIKSVAKKEGKTFNEVVSEALEYELNKTEEELDNVNS